MSRAWKRPGTATVLPPAGMASGGAGTKPFGHGTLVPIVAARTHGPAEQLRRLGAQYTMGGYGSREWRALVPRAGAAPAVLVARAPARRGGLPRSMASWKHPPAASYSCYRQAAPSTAIARCVKVIPSYAEIKFHVQPGPPRQHAARARSRSPFKAMTGINHTNDPAPLRKTFSEPTAGSGGQAHPPACLPGRAS